MDDGILGVKEIMAVIASFVLDLFGFFCLIISLGGDADLGETLSLIPDFLGFIFLGGWTAFKSVKGVGRKVRKKFFLTFLCELFPFIGGLPFWTIYTFSNLKSKGVRLKPK
jgi:predicted permease